MRYENQMENQITQGNALHQPPHILCLPIDLKVLLSHVPVIDLITLLVLKDLKLFQVLFSLFPKIAIGQETMRELQWLAQPLAGSWARQSCLDVIASLKAHFHQIIQPVSSESHGEEFREGKSSEEVKKLVIQKNYMLYSDDAVFRAYVGVPSEPVCAMCTLDLMHAAEAKVLMTAEQVAESVGTLCQWNVSIVVTSKNMFASIPAEITKARSVAEGIGVLQSGKLTAPIFEGIWNIHKPYGELLKHIGALLGELLSNPANRLETIIAIWGLWYIKMKFRGDAAVVPVWKHLIFLMAAAARDIKPPSAASIHRLWQAYDELISFEFGDRMDVKYEQESYRLAGRMVADIDASAQKNGVQPIQRVLAHGLTENTAQHTWFTEGHSNRQIEHTREDKRVN